jgi:hypothetical protein
MNYLRAYKAPNKESLFASLHILMRAILMAQRTPAAGLADTGIEKAAAKSAPAGKYKISVNPVILSNLSSCLCVLVAINQRNLRLINDLRVCKLLYNCREDSTTIESSLQNNLFMQNKAKFQKVKLNVNKVLTKDYEKMDTWSIGKNEPKTNPNEPKTNPIKANKMPMLTYTVYGSKREAAGMGGN